MARILILYSSVDGQTVKICSRLKARVEESGDEVTLAALEASETLALPAFDKIVIGASIRYGKHRGSVYDFVARHLALLEATPAAFFSVSLVARKADKGSPDSNPYLLKFLRAIAWRPRAVAVFAGKLDYRKYGVCDRLMIRVIMKLTKGPSDPATVVEYTDWAAVDAFARRIGTL